MSDVYFSARMKNKILMEKRELKTDVFKAYVSKSGHH
jgi:hypothetical protein